jgi:hypothetical protein
LTKDFQNVFPSRNTFEFENGIKISSDFDAGNLMACKMATEERHYLSQRELKDIVNGDRAEDS